MKISDIQDLASALGMIGQGMPCGQKLGFARALNRRLLAPVLEAIEETYQALVDEHCEHEEDGARKLLANGNVALRDAKAFSAAWEAFRAQDVEVGARLRRVALSDLPAEMPAMLYDGLAPMLTEFEDAAADDAGPIVLPTMPRAAPAETPIAAPVSAAEAA